MVKAKCRRWINSAVIESLLFQGVREKKQNKPFRRRWIGVRIMKDSRAAGMENKRHGQPKSRAPCAFNDDSNSAGRRMPAMQRFEARNMCQPKGTAAMIEKG